MSTVPSRGHNSNACNYFKKEGRCRMLSIGFESKYWGWKTSTGKVVIFHIQSNQSEYISFPTVSGIVSKLESWTPESFIKFLYSPSMGVLLSGRFANTTSTYSSCSLWREPFNPGNRSRANRKSPKWALLERVEVWLSLRIYFFKIKKHWISFKEALNTMMCCLTPKSL